MKQIEYFNINGKPVFVEDTDLNRKEFEAAGFVSKMPAGGFDRSQKPIRPSSVLDKIHNRGNRSGG